MADKYLLDIKGKAEEHIEGSDKKKDINFPLCMAIQYMNNSPLECPDFILNSSKKIVFIRTDFPLPEGAKVNIHFYIPPDLKLLSEFKGKVIKKPDFASNTRGNYIRIRDFFHIKLNRLESFLEEKRHLIDEKV